MNAEILILQEALEKRKNEVMLKPIKRHMFLSFVWGILCICFKKEKLLHELLFISEPFEWLIPNIGFYAEQSVDASFTRVFIAGSLVIYILLFVPYIKSLDAKLGNVYPSRAAKITFFIFFGGLFFCGALIPWLVSIDVSEGVVTRSDHWVSAGVSSHFGVIFSLNALLVSCPMIFFQVVAWGWFTGSISDD